MTANHINDLLTRRLKHGQTTAKRLQLAAGLNVNPISAIIAEFIDTQADIKLPEPAKSGMAGAGQYLWDKQAGAESRSRFALACAESLLPRLPEPLRSRCRRLYLLAWAYVAVPTQQELLKTIRQQRVRLRPLWEAWLASAAAQTDAGHAAASAYCGFGLCLTAVEENMEPVTTMRFQITDPAQSAGYLRYGDEPIFWEALRRDFIPWLIGGSLPTA